MGICARTLYAVAKAILTDNEAGRYFADFSELCQKSRNFISSLFNIFLISSFLIQIIVHDRILMAMYLLVHFSERISLHGAKRPT